MALQKKQSLIEYRVSRLEEVVLKLSNMAEVVARWDERFTANGGLLQCGMHATRMAEVEAKLAEIAKITSDRTRDSLLVTEHEEKLKAIAKEVSELKAFAYKAIGALLGISVVVQLAGPIVLHFFKL